MSALGQVVGSIVVLSVFVTMVILNSSSVAAFIQKDTWEAPPASRNMINPIALNRKVLEEGLELYRKNCLTCHGEQGKGDGPAVEFIESRPRDLTIPEFTRQNTDGEIFWKVTEGRKPMPPFKKKLSDDERWKLVNYIRVLGRK
jgi:mono/diheme cytochrome c family protein